MLEPAIILLPDSRAAKVPDLAREHFAVRCRGALSVDACASFSNAILDARESWTANFGGKQFTLGRAYYTHLEEDREGEYFGGAARSDAVVRRVVPGLQEAMLRLAEQTLGGVAAQRPGWCGPGVHIFPARGEVARRGGEVHFDTEGLTPAQIERRAPAVSMVLMLQLPASGGGLRVWDRLYDGDDCPGKPDPDTGVTQIAYEVGELVAFDSYRLHQILPFRGDIPRVSATLHACYERGAWESWF
jgi:hypothetical protein